MNVKQKQQSHIRQFFRAFIPTHISNRLVVRIYQMLAWAAVPDRIRKRNRIRNKERLAQTQWTFWKDTQAYIENQDEWKDIWFGAGAHHSMRYSGCGIIAAWNAWKALGLSASPEWMAELIYEYEAKGAALWGVCGVSPAAIARHFKRNGFSVIETADEKDGLPARIGRECPAVIATAYNDRNNLLQQIHTVCITGNEKQGYVLHNTYLVDEQGRYRASMPYPTLMEAVGHISKYEPKLIYLIGIAPKTQKG